MLKLFNKIYSKNTSKKEKKSLNIYDNCHYTRIFSLPYLLLLIKREVCTPFYQFNAEIGNDNTYIVAMYEKMTN